LYCIVATDIIGFSFSAPKFGDPHGAVGRQGFVFASRKFD